ncbi:hypothetical protein C8R43DRAFT_1191480 [Mycena crocata]|nr:hypothetical protein C8R43DRAFT_1191480 [Mycena crocata]
MTKPKDLITILMNLPNLRELEILGPGGWSNQEGLLQLRDSGPRIRSLRVNANHCPGAALFQPPPNLKLVALKLSAKWVTDVGPLNPHIRRIFTVHGNHLCSLSVQGKLQDVTVLDICTQLERFECQTFPSDELVPAVPRTITALAVGMPIVLPSRNFIPFLESAPRLLNMQPPPVSVEYLKQQLDSAPAWDHPFLRNSFPCRCIPSDEAVEYSLRQQLLKV